MRTRRLLAEPTPALEQMLREDAEAGFRPLDDPPPPPGPPQQAQPLVRPAFPAPHWRREEEERAEREARETAAANQDKLEPPQQSYPAPKKKRAAKGIDA
jgi:hypothetical protein